MKGTCFMACQWIEDPGASVWFLVLSLRMFSDCVSLQINPSGTGEENWVTANTRSAKGHHLEACTSSRKSGHIPEAGS